MRTSFTLDLTRPSNTAQKEGRTSVAKITVPTPQSLIVTSRSKVRSTSIPYLSRIRAPSSVRQLSEEKSLILSRKAGIECRRPRSPIPVSTRSSITRPLVIGGVLPPQTFRTPHGTIVIQPSGSVLVDLREGERMKGRRGGVVLVVHSEGNMVFGFSHSNLNLASDTFLRSMYTPHHISACHVYYKHRYLPGNFAHCHRNLQSHMTLPQNICRLSGGGRLWYAVVL
jgi:hypothetical protein